MDYILDQSLLPSHVRILPIYALNLSFADDTFRLELLEADSSLEVRGIGEPDDKGGEQMTAVAYSGTAVVMHNTYGRDELRVLLRRLATEGVEDLRVELQPLAAQDSGATMQVGVDDTQATVRSISIPPWTIEWITTERPRMKIAFSGLFSIDVMEDWDDAGTLKSKLFHQLTGF